MLKNSDAVYIMTGPASRGDYVKKALENGCHVMCESPISLKKLVQKTYIIMLNNMNSFCLKL